MIKYLRPSDTTTGKRARKATTTPKHPSDTKFGFKSVCNFRKTIVKTKTYRKAFFFEAPGPDPSGRFEARKESFLHKDVDRLTTSTFGGDVEISAFALTRDFICNVWIPKGDTITLSDFEFARTQSAHKHVHFLFKQSQNPEKPGEPLRCGHFDVLLPIDDLPSFPAHTPRLKTDQGTELALIRCPDNGHCLFYAMTFLDQLYSPEIVDDVTESATENEALIVGSLTPSEETANSDSNLSHL